MTLSKEQIKEKLTAFTGWDFSGTQLEKTYSFKDFMTALDFVNKVGIVAEHEDHHPDILIQYNKVKLGLSTHSEDGITEKDFILAKQIEQLAVITV